MAEVAPTALLFDVDGTLVNTAGAGSRAFERALRGWFGRPVFFDGYDPSGRTDLEILRALAAREGLRVPDESQTRRFFDSFVTALGEELRAGPCGGTCPGVGRLLGALREDPRWITGLLTGNVARAAALKMRHYGLDHGFVWLPERNAAASDSRSGSFEPASVASPDAALPPIWGAYGDDAEDRCALVPIALARLPIYAPGRPGPSGVIVIGDTERDEACARVAGAKVLLVGTGWRKRVDLQACSPDAYLEDLSDLDRAIATLTELAAFW